MINKVTLTLKGDFKELQLSRDEGSRFIDMQFHAHNGAWFANFKLADLKRALELLDDTESES